MYFRQHLSFTLGGGGGDSYFGIGKPKRKATGMSNQWQWRQASYCATYTQEITIFNQTEQPFRNGVAAVLTLTDKQLSMTIWSDLSQLAAQFVELLLTIMRDYFHCVTKIYYSSGCTVLIYFMSVIYKNCNNFLPHKQI